jgi:hypothetical protein
MNGPSTALQSSEKIKVEYSIESNDDVLNVGKSHSLEAALFLDDDKSNGNRNSERLYIRGRNPEHIAASSNQMI